MSSSLRSEESSGQEQNVAMDDLISQGIDAGDVQKLMDAGIESSGQLQHVEIDKLISQGIDAGDVEMLRDAGIVTCNDLMHIKKNLTGIKGLSEAKVDNNSEATEIVITVTYNNYKTIISNAAENEKKKKNLFGFAGDVKSAHLKVISLEIEKTNKHFARDDEFLLKDFIEVDEAIKGKKKEKMRDIQIIR